MCSCICVCAFVHIYVLIPHISLLASAHILVCIYMYHHLYMHISRLYLQESHSRIPCICWCKNVPSFVLRLKFNAHLVKHWHTHARMHTFGQTLAHTCTHTHTNTRTHTHALTHSLSLTHTHTTHKTTMFTMPPFFTIKKLTPAPARMRSHLASLESTSTGMTACWLLLLKGFHENHGVLAKNGGLHWSSR